MDIVVDDVPPKYGMLLSRSSGAKLQGSLQLDMSYATIFVFGQPKKLYRETFMKYMVSSQNRPQNYPIYSMHLDVDSFIMFNTNQTPKETPNSVIVEPKKLQFLLLMNLKRLQNCAKKKVMRLLKIKINGILLMRTMYMKYYDI